jgi:biotin carboxyl carrier protein
MDQQPRSGVQMNLTLHINGQSVSVEVLERKAQAIQFRFQGKTYRFMGQKARDGSWLIDTETAPGLWQRHTGTLWHGGRNITRVQSGAQDAKATEITAGVADNAGTTALSPTAPMPGVIRKILTRKHAAVKDGDPLLVLEAMKLQLTLSAGGDGTVNEILVREGEMVAEGAELVRITAKEAKKGR